MVRRPQAPRSKRGGAQNLKSSRIVTNIRFQGRYDDETESRSGLHYGQCGSELSFREHDTCYAAPPCSVVSSHTASWLSRVS